MRIDRKIFLNLMPLLIFLALSGDSIAKPQMLKEKELVVNFIQLEHTNPSMGPHEKRRSYYLANTKKHKKAILDFLDHSKVFRFTLREYLVAYLKKDQLILSEIKKEISKVDSKEFADGGKISHLTIGLKDHEAIRLSDLRFYALSGKYSNFIEYLVKNGKKNESSLEKSN